MNNYKIINFKTDELHEPILDLDLKAAEGEQVQFEYDTKLGTIECWGKLIEVIAGEVLNHCRIKPEKNSKINKNTIMISSDQLIQIPLRD